MPVLTIRWQRLLNAKGRTCPRCGGTQLEVERAVQDLKRALRPLGIQVRSERKALTWKAFRRNPAASNKIWVGGEPLERWLGAREGKSRCCGACGEAACRTVEVGKESYETIPSRLIVSAGLYAAARMLSARGTVRAPPSRQGSTDGKSLVIPPVPDAGREKRFRDSLGGSSKNGILT